MAGKDAGRTWISPRIEAEHLLSLSSAYRER